MLVVEWAEDQPTVLCGCISFCSRHTSQLQCWYSWLEVQYCVCAQREKKQHTFVFFFSATDEFQKWERKMFVLNVQLSFICSGWKYYLQKEEMLQQLKEFKLNAILCVHVCMQCTKSVTIGIKWKLCSVFQRSLWPLFLTCTSSHSTGPPTTEH